MGGRAGSCKQDYDHASTPGRAARLRPHSCSPTQAQAQAQSRAETETEAEAAAGAEVGAEAEAEDRTRARWSRRSAVAARGR
eukprot:scaffold66947_cov56-Phaeocystis_antarctica.AAC.4